MRRRKLVNRLVPGGNIMLRGILHCGYTVVGSLLLGCASGVVYAPTSLNTATTSLGSVAKLSKPVEIKLMTGYARELKADSEWRPVGRIPEGEVFSPNKDVFTVEGTHVHEAYLVIDSGQLVGFYLPAERAFSIYRPRVPLTLSPSSP